MKKKEGNRLIALLLALFMAVTMMPDMAVLHIAKLIGRVCGAKWPHSVSKQPISTVFE